MSIPTVREVLDACDEHPGFTGCKSCEVLDRLDPDTQVIVDRDSLAAALHATAGKNHNLGDGMLRAICQSESSHGQRADAIIAALRGAK